jgi:hypothetical protein
MIERLGPKCAIGTDGRQWIIYAAAAAAGDTRIAWDGQTWRSAPGQPKTGRRFNPGTKHTKDHGCTSSSDQHLYSDGQAAHASTDFCKRRRENPSLKRPGCPVAPE